MRQTLIGHFVVSYPKSGRTWLRFMLTRALAVHLGIEDRLLTYPNQAVLASRAWRMPLIGFTHQGSSRPLSWSGGGRIVSFRFYRSKKVVLLVRDPRDIVVSNFYHRTCRLGESHSLSEFIRDSDWGATRAIDFMASWYRHRHVPKDLILVRYEDLSRNPSYELSRVLEFVGLARLNDRVLEEAVRYASFDHMRRLALGRLSADATLAPTDPNDANSHKIREGAVGSFRRQLSGRDAEWIDDLMASRLPDFFGYSPAGCLGD